MLRRFIPLPPFFNGHRAQDPNGIAAPDHPLIKDLRPQPAAVDQRLLDARLGQPLEVAAGIAEAPAAQRHLPDGEVPVDQVIESDPAGRAASIDPGLTSATLSNWYAGGVAASQNPYALFDY